MKTLLSLRLALLIAALTTSLTALAQVPRIDLVSPASGNVGMPVTISGANFSSTPADNIVYFGAVRAIVTSASANSLTTIVPASATYAPITLTVGGRTAWANAPFTPTFSSSGRFDFSLFAPRVDLPAAPVNPSDPRGTSGVAIGDIDGDGKPDVLALNYSAGSLSVFRNISTPGVIGPSSFEPRVDVAANIGAASLGLGDLDGDGKLDVVVFDVTGFLSIFQNTSTPGAVSFGPRISLGGLGTPFNPRSVVIRDLDGDGKPELILSGGGLYLIRNNSTPGILNASSFGAPVLFDVAPFGVGGLVVSDLDGDGKPDVAMAVGGRLSVFRNTTTPGHIDSSSLAPHVDFVTGAIAQTVAVADFNGDGKPDLAVMGQGGPNIIGTGYQNVLSIFENVSTPGSFTSSSLGPRWDLPACDYALDLLVTDLDGDGKPDLASAMYGGNAVMTVFQNAAGLGQPFAPESFANPRLFSLAAPSVIAGTSFPQWSPQSGYPLGGAAPSMAIGDLDGDGMPDVVVGALSDFISILQNTVSPCTGPAPVVISASSINGANIAIRFDREVTCASALDKVRYVVNGGGVTVNGVTIRSTDQRTVVLEVSGLSSLPNTAFTVTVYGIQSCTQGEAGGGTATGHVQALSPLALIDLGDPVNPDYSVERFHPTSVYAWRDGTITVTAAGHGIRSSEDGCNFLYQPMTGDFDMKVRVSRLDSVPGFTRAGLMVRENLSAGSANYNVVVVPLGGENRYETAFQSVQDGADAPWPDSSVSYGVSWPNGWIRLKREGQTFTAFRSDNGTTWEQFAQTTASTPFAGTALVGLCTTSGGYGIPATADYNDFSVVSLTDTTPPTIACPANIVTTTAPGQCSAIVNYTVTATDHSGSATVVSSPPSGSTFPKGTTTVNSTATDGSGNQSSCSFTVTVNDAEKPTISCPGNITVGCSIDLLTPVSFAATAHDNCDPNPSLIYSPISGSGFPVGTTTVTCTATDSSGNQSSCNFTVTRAALNFTGFLSPIGGADAMGGSFGDTLRAFKLKSTIPVKFSAACGGSPVLSGVHTLQAIKWSSQTDSDPAIDATPTDAATTGNQFRLVGSEWHFNLDTKATGMTTGTWQLIATLSDGSQHAVWIQIK